MTFVRKPHTGEKYSTRLYIWVAAVIMRVIKLNRRLIQTPLVDQPPVLSQQRSDECYTISVTGVSIWDERMFCRISPELSISLICLC